MRASATRWALSGSISASPSSSSTTRSTTAGSSAKLGKTVGDDFREGKVTLPVILAFAQATDDDRAFWRRTIESGKQTDRDMPTAIALLERTGALEETMTRARAYARAAKDALNDLPRNVYSRSLCDIADFCVDRAY